MPMPKGYVVTKKRVDLRRKAVADVRHLCLGRPENKKNPYWWETTPFDPKEHKGDVKKHQKEFDEQERNKQKHYEALIEATENNAKILRWMFVKGKRSLKNFVKKEMREFEEESGGKLTKELLRHGLLRFDDGRLRDLEAVEEAASKGKGVEHKFKGESTEEEDVSG